MNAPFPENAPHESDLPEESSTGESATKKPSTGESWSDVGRANTDGPDPTLDREQRAKRRDERAKEAAAHQAEMDTARSQYEELAELAGSLAHEIKNPLSIIHMNIDLLSEDLVEIDTPSSRRCLPRVDMVRDQCERMEGLLRDFLRYARLRQIDLLPGSLNDQVDRVLDAYQTQADAQKVDLQSYLDPDLPSIRLHSDSLQSALMNLVKNALEAMPDGGQLLVRTYSNRGGVILDLIDSGTGLDDNTVMHMFEPFYSTKDGGSGLGLPTARKIIEAHGGRISVQSEVGRGTQFSLQFPVPPRLQ